jgi:hypothetical protein
MDKEDFKIVNNAAGNLDIISRAISTLQNSNELYFITDYSIMNRFDTRDAIKIPQCLIDEFKDRLIAYYAERYNVIVEDLKKVTL